MGGEEGVSGPPFSPRSFMSVQETPVVCQRASVNHSTACPLFIGYPLCVWTS